MKYLILSLMLFTSCSQLQWFMDNYPEDNIAEELIEEVIEAKTGLEIDLSPFSDEDD